jgi:hypothetical protein
LLYSELTDEFWETRKVEEFADRTVGYADSMKAEGGTHLSIEPLPPISVIAADLEFGPTFIEQKEFEQLWARREKRVRGS